MNRIERAIHRAALANTPYRGEITPAESKRAGEWEREQVKAAEDHAAYRRSVRARRNGRRPGSTLQAMAAEQRMPWPKNEVRPEDALRSRASFLP